MFQLQGGGRAPSGAVGLCWGDTPPGAALGGPGAPAFPAPSWECQDPCCSEQVAGLLGDPTPFSDVRRPSWKALGTAPLSLFLILVIYALIELHGPRCVFPNMYVAPRGQ